MCEMKPIFGRILGSDKIFLCMGTTFMCLSSFFMVL